MHALQLPVQHSAGKGHFDRRAVVALAVATPWRIRVSARPKTGGMGVFRNAMAQVANGDGRAVAVVAESVDDDGGGTVRDQRILLHFPEPSTPIVGPTFRGLAREQLLRTVGTRVVLVRHHVAQPMVVTRSHAHRGLEHFTGAAIDQHLLSSHAQLFEFIRDRIHVHLAKRRGVAFGNPFDALCFAYHDLEHLPDLKKMLR